jgi:hypothetical protein
VGERAAQVLPALQGWQRHRVAPTGPPAPATQPWRRNEAPAGPSLALVRRQAAAAPQRKEAPYHPRGGWDRPRKSAACGMQGRRPALVRLPRLAVYRLATSRQRLPVPRSRRAEAASAQQQVLAPQPTPLDLNGELAPTSGCLRAARVCRRRPWTKMDRFRAKRPAFLVEASG